MAETAIHQLDCPECDGLALASYDESGREWTCTACGEHGVASYEDLEEVDDIDD